MATIRHRVGIEGRVEDVYGALSSLEGLGGWWTPVDGDTAPGGRLDFYFPSAGRGVEMEVTESVPGKRVEWRCVGGPDEWVGTALTFDLRPDDGETVLTFAHEGWREPGEFMAHCSTKWGVFMLSLKALVESGRGTPCPDDARISVGWG